MPFELNFLKPHGRDKSPYPCVGEEPTNPILRQAEELGTKALVKQAGNSILFVGLVFLSANFKNVDTYC